MKPVKKQLEILLMDYFRKCYTDFPKGKITPGESPDFILKLKTKNNLGIELTRLNPANAKSPGAKEVERNLSRNEIIEQAKELFIQSSPLTLFVKFLFSDKSPIADERKMIVSVQLAGIIREAVRDKKPGQFFYLPVSESSLPKGLDKLLIIHHPHLETNIWERSNNLGISGNVLDDIKKSILKKDDKLRLYQKQRLNYYWLLILTDRLRGIKRFNLDNKVLNHTFHSQFQRVFLFDLIKSNIFELV